VTSIRLQPQTTEDAT